MHYFSYSDIFITFCQKFSYRVKVGRRINIFTIFFKMAIKIAGSAQKRRVGRISGNTGILGLTSCIGGKDLIASPFSQRKEIQTNQLSMFKISSFKQA